MAPGRLSLAVLLTVGALLLHTTAGQKIHAVGDRLGWIVPPGGPVAYEVWASTQSFVIGDVLWFNFTTGQQDVARVIKEAFENCNSTNPISLKTDGPANFTLDTDGEYYFISTMDKHCPLGQKLAINVTSTPAPCPSPGGAPPPEVARGPITYVVGDDLGWLVPPGGSIAYKIWASGKTFIVGDSLVFNFVNGTQDVAVVTKTVYESCNTSSTTSVLTSSPAKVTLTAPGEQYFTSTYSRHCEFGQKLAINVTGAAGRATPPTLTTAPSPSGLSSAGPTAGGPAPPPVSSASTRVVASLSIALLSMVIALIH